MSMTISKRNKRVLIIYTILLAVIVGLTIALITTKKSYEAQIENIQSQDKLEAEQLSQEVDTYQKLYNDSEQKLLSVSRELKATQQSYETYKSTVADAAQKESTVVRDSDYNVKKFDPITVDELNAWIKEKSPADSPFIDKADVFIKASNESNLDPKFIFSLASVESSYGRSEIAEDKGNYFGISAYNATPYESSKSFNGNLEDCIVSGAKWIAQNYSEGSYMSLASMQSGSKAYCQLDNGTPSYNWISSIVSIMN